MYSMLTFRRRTQSNETSRIGENAGRTISVLNTTAMTFCIGNRTQFPDNIETALVKRDTLTHISLMAFEAIQLLQLLLSTSIILHFCKHQQSSIRFQVFKSIYVCCICIIAYIYLTIIIIFNENYNSLFSFIFVLNCILELILNSLKYFQTNIPICEYYMLRAS